MEKQSSNYQRSHRIDCIDKFDTNQIIMLDSDANVLSVHSLDSGNPSKS
jgi:hypothetical protein